MTVLVQSQGYIYKEIHTQHMPSNCHLTVSTPLQHHSAAFPLPFDLPPAQVENGLWPFLLLPQQQGVLQLCAAQHLSPQRKSVNLLLLFCISPSITHLLLPPTLPFCPHIPPLLFTSLPSSWTFSVSLLLSSCKCMAVFFASLNCSFKEGCSVLGSACLNEASKLCGGGRQVGTRWDGKGTNKRVREKQMGKGEEWRKIVHREVETRTERDCKDEGQFLCTCMRAVRSPFGVHPFRAGVLPGLRLSGCNQSRPVATCLLLHSPGDGNQRLHPPPLSFLLHQQFPHCVGSSQIFHS